MILAAESLTRSHLRSDTYADDLSGQLTAQPGKKTRSVRPPAPYGDDRLARFESVRANPRHT